MRMLLLPLLVVVLLRARILLLLVVVVLAVAAMAITAAALTVAAGLQVPAVEASASKPQGALTSVLTSALTSAPQRRVVSSQGVYSLLLCGLVQVASPGE